LDAEYQHIFHEEGHGVFRKMIEKSSRSQGVEGSSENLKNKEVATLNLEP